MSDQYQPAGAITLAREDAATVTLRIHLPQSSPERKKRALVLLLYLAALAAAVYGCIVLRGVDGFSRSESRELAAGAPLLAVAFFVWLLAELLDNWSALAAWWGRHDRLGKARWLARILPLLAALKGVDALFESMTAAAESALALVVGALGFFALTAVLLVLIAVAERWLRRRPDAFPILAGWIEEKASQPPASVVRPFSWPALSLESIGAARIRVIALAALCSLYVWANSTGNVFLPPTFVVWVLSTVLWALAFAPRDWNPLLWLVSKLSGDWVVPWRRYWWAYIAFALIMFVAIHFRLTELEIMPAVYHLGPYANVMDAYNWAHGIEMPLYFAADHGRPMLFYYPVAALASFPGFGFNYYTLKLTYALHGLLSVPAVFWLGVEFHGAHRRNCGIVCGLLLAGLLAVSHWHVATSRIGYESAVTVPFAALLGVFLIRAIRHNRRADYILAGLTLGYSLYAYHAARAFPLAVVAAVLIALALRRVSWRERLAYCLNLALLAFVAIMVFLPMFHFMVEFPDRFWGRLNVLARTEVASPEETSGLEVVVSAVMRNVRKHLLMYHFSGDREPWRGGFGIPALGVYSGALLVLGLAALVARLARSRDPVIWTLPAILVITHLGAIAVVERGYQFSVPSQIRTLGAMPYIYLLSSFALAIIARQFYRAFPKGIALPLGTMLCGALMLLGYQQNSEFYFGRHRELALDWFPPANEGAKILRGYIDSGGVASNAFLIRNTSQMGELRHIALEAGLMGFPNEIRDLSQISNLIIAASRREANPLDAERDLLFLHSPNHQDALDALRRLFPQGYMQLIPSRNIDNYAFAAYRVPALGEEALNEIIQEAQS